CVLLIFRFQLFERERSLLLYIAPALIGKKLKIVLVSTFPCMLVWLCAERGDIFWTSWERKHGYRLGNPDAVRLEALLPGSDLAWIILRSLDQVCLNPWN